PVLLSVNGYVRGRYYSTTQQSNAGVSAAVRVNAEVCAQDLSFEALSSAITFHSNAKCLIALAPGTHTLEVLDVMGGAYPNMSAYHALLQYEALAIGSSATSGVVFAKEVTSDTDSVTTSLVNTRPVLVSITGSVQGLYYNT